jgi:hypothetical protein
MNDKTQWRRVLAPSPLNGTGVRGEKIVGVLIWQVDHSMIALTSPYPLPSPPGAERESFRTRVSCAAVSLSQEKEVSWKPAH